MRYALLPVLAFASGVVAHTRVYSLWVDGEDQGDGRETYVRSPPSNSPVKDLTSADLACNVNGATEAKEWLSIAAGSQVAFEWYHDARNDDYIAASHLGPVITYVAPYTEGSDGTGAIWSKIDEEGYDAASGKWAVDNLIANKGKKEFTLPSSLAAGKCLVRQEIIGLHEADAAYSANSARGAQFYPSCAQVEVTGSGTATPDQNFELPGGYSDSDPGVVFNLYGTVTSYTIPGPELWSGSSSGGSSGGASSAPAATSAPTATSSAAAGASSSAAAQPTTLSTAVKPSTTAAAPVPTKTQGSKCKGKGKKRRNALRH